MSNEPRKHFAGELTVCQSCAEPIEFLVHERTGKLSPITVASYSNGNTAAMSGHRYRVLNPASANMARLQGASLRLNHFVNCPDAKRFGRKE